MKCVAHMRMMATVRALAWGSGTLAVLADKLHLVRVSDDGSMAQHASAHVGAAHISALAWHQGAWHWGTSGGLCTWAVEENDAPSTVSIRAAHVAGGDAVQAVLDDGRAYHWNGTLGPSHLQAGPEGLWGVARDAATGLLAVVRGAEEPGALRYCVTRRLVYELWSPSALGNAPTPLPKLTLPPMYSWRAWMFEIVLGSDATPLWNYLAERIAALHACACRMSAGQDDEDVSGVHQEAQALDWMVTWASAAGRAEATATTAPDTQAWLSTYLGAIRSAQHAPRDTPYAERLAGMLFLLSRNALASGDTAASLRKHSAALVPQATFAAWERAGSPQLDAACPACGGVVGFELAQFARCTANHVFERCVATLALVDSTDTWTCVGCARQALAPVLCALHTSFPTPAACRACGNRWRAR